jgi:hypothetical protein
MLQEDYDLTREAERTANERVRNVHGAKLLADIFKEFSEPRVEYDKVKYGMALTEWILEHAPDGLAGVANVIDSRLKFTP